MSDWGIAMEVKAIKDEPGREQGFTVIEVAMASLITMIGLIYLASLFTLAISQNRLIKHFTSTTTLAQEKIEELNAIQPNDPRLNLGGSLTAETKVGNLDYFEPVLVDDFGTVTVGDEIPEGQIPNYRRFWQVEVESNAAFPDTKIISVRVVSLQPGRNGGMAEETVLVSVRSN
jgi:hypothetical protein